MGDVQTAVLQAATTAAAALYIIWLGHRIYMALGKCPQCNQRLHRAAAVCGTCGCRQHEKSLDQSQSI